MTRQSFPDLRFINMCGNYGDAIYHPRFHDIMEHLKHQGFDLRLETKGCHRPARWWRRTAEILSRRDRVTLSIDGLDDTNHIYRVNARWPDILEAVAAFKGRVFLVWKLIIFRHKSAVGRGGGGACARAGLRRVPDRPQQPLRRSLARPGRHRPAETDGRVGRRA
jgi:hypothetical protein